MQRNNSPPLEGWRRSRRGGYKEHTPKSPLERGLETAAHDVYHAGQIRFVAETGGDEEINSKGKMKKMKALI